MKYHKLVSVIIPTFNRAKLVNRALKSVLTQTHKNFEVIVVDDGSTDQTVHQLEHKPHLVLIHQKQLGVSAARNTGLQHAKGDLIAFLDSDDEWLSKKLERQVEFFEKNPDAMIAQTDEIWIRNGKRVNPMKKHKKPSGWIFNECLPLCVVSPSCVMMRRELFEQIGHFDETFPACEDYDFWLRVAARFPIHLINEKLVVKYGGHEDQLSRVIPFLDRYRINAIHKSLQSEILNQSQQAAAFGELEKKCTIYANGCRKHKKKKEAEEILSLLNQYKKIFSKKT